MYFFHFPILSPLFIIQSKIKKFKWPPKSSLSYFLLQVYKIQYTYNRQNIYGPTVRCLKRRLVCLTTSFYRFDCKFSDHSEYRNIKLQIIQGVDTNWDRQLCVALTLYFYLYQKYFLLLRNTHTLNPIGLSKQQGYMDN